MDERPAPRFAVGQMVLCEVKTDGWVGPLEVAGMQFGTSEFGEPYRGWFYRLTPLTPLRDELMSAFSWASPGEPHLRPYDPPADQSYDELMAGLRDPDAVQRNLERDYLTEQYGEPV